MKHKIKSHWRGFLIGARLQIQEMICVSSDGGSRRKEWEDTGTVRGEAEKAKGLIRMSWICPKRLYETREPITLCASVSLYARVFALVSLFSEIQNVEVYGKEKINIGLIVTSQLIFQNYDQPW